MFPFTRSSRHFNPPLKPKTTTLRLTHDIWIWPSCPDIWAGIVLWVPGSTGGGGGRPQDNQLYLWAPLPGLTWGHQCGAGATPGPPENIDQNAREGKPHCYSHRPLPLISIPTHWLLCSPTILQPVLCQIVSTLMDHPAPCHPFTLFDIFSCNTLCPTGPKGLDIRIPKAVADDWASDIKR